MSDSERVCFLIMPFKPELYYFYLFIKQHIEEQPDFRCERADAQYLAKPIPDKIYDFIQKADVIIADCSGSNANVFYEIGMAYALNKKVILITNDSLDHIPFDVKHYEIIRYDLDEHVNFLNRLDGALDNIFSERYKKLYEPAKALFKEFRKSVPTIGEAVSEDEFIARVKNAERSQDIPAPEHFSELAYFVLPKMISDPTNIAVMEQVLAWLKNYLESKKADPNRIRTGSGSGSGSGRSPRNKKSDSNPPIK